MFPANQGGRMTCETQIAFSRELLLIIYEQYTLQLTSYRADFVQVEGRLGGVADDEDEDNGGEDSGHGVVPPGGRGDHRVDKVKPKA